MSAESICFQDEGIDARHYFSKTIHFIYFNSCISTAENFPLKSTFFDYRFWRISVARISKCLAYNLLSVFGWKKLNRILEKDKHVK